MKWQQLIIENYERVAQVLEKSLEGLTLDDLNLQYRPDCNSIGWLTWHLTRAQDSVISDFMGEEQLWIKDNWYAKFNRPPDAMDTGYGHGSKDLAGFTSPDIQILKDYYRAVLERTKRYIINLSETELDREIDHPRFPTVGMRIVSIISDNLQHAGQVAYLHGLLKGKG